MDFTDEETEGFCKHRASHWKRKGPRFEPDCLTSELEISITLHTKCLWILTKFLVQLSIVTTGSLNVKNLFQSSLKGSGLNGRTLA
jgi:hypothetical protein